MYYVGFLTCMYYMKMKIYITRLDAPKILDFSRGDLGDI